METASPKRPIGAAILAGGKATRYLGAAKGRLADGEGTPIIQRIIREIAGAGIEETVILANDADSYRDCLLPIIPDQRQGLGPLGGIEAALDYFSGRRQGVLIVPCDMPGFSRREIAPLLEAYLEGGEARIVVARTRAGSRFFYHPLCAIIDSGLLANVRQALDAGERKVGRLWREWGSRPVDFDDPQPFFNINSPDDMDRWLAESRRT